MFERFFGFSRAPFELVPDPDFLFLGESHDSALANLELGIGAGKGFVAITGPIGAGKTTILRALLRRLGRTDRVCFLTQPETETADLLRAILDGFGVSADGAPLVELRRRIRDLLAADARPGILIIDEAHLLREDALEQIRLLSNLEEDRRKLLQIVLSGQPELKALLSSPRLRPLAQRIEMFYEIRPLSLEETEAYLSRRVQIAGGRKDIFSPEASASIHACTGGIPRLINVLADRSLLSAYVAESPVVSAEVVADAFDDLGEVTHSVMPGRPSKRRFKIVRAKRAPEPEREPEIEIERDAPRPRRRARARWLAGTAAAAVITIGAVALAGQWLRGDGRVAAAHSDEAAAEAARAAPRADATPKASPAAPRGGTHAVHVASFRDERKAQDLARELGAQIESPITISPTQLESGTWYRVLVGRFTTRDQARAAMEELRTRREFAFVRTVRVPESELRGEGT